MEKKYLFKRAINKKLTHLDISYMLVLYIIKNYLIHGDIFPYIFPPSVVFRPSKDSYQVLIF